MDPFFAEMAARIGSVPGVVAIALGGSRARGNADDHSDADIGIYYNAGAPPDITQLSTLARDLDDRRPAEPLTPIGGWGPWIDGGGWLVIGGRRVDWIYRELGRVGEAIADCRAGRVTSHYQPGHPHAFHTYIYMGEVHHAVALHDPEGILRALAASTTPYPPALRQAIVDAFLWEADFALATAEKSAARGDVYHATGSFFRSVACVIQVLFAVNARYFVNEKRSVEAVRSFARRPAGFGETVAAAFSGSRSPRETLRSLAALVEETRALSANPGR
jgi:Nucleotidyltransferase domain